MLCARCHPIKTATICDLPNHCDTIAKSEWAGAFAAEKSAWSLAYLLEPIEWLAMRRAAASGYVPKRCRAVGEKWEVRGEERDKNRLAGSCLKKDVSSLTQSNAQIIAILSASLWKQGGLMGKRWKPSRNESMMHSLSSTILHLRLTWLEDTLV